MCPQYGCCWRITRRFGRPHSVMRWVRFFSPEPHRDIGPWVRDQLALEVDPATESGRRATEAGLHAAPVSGSITGQTRETGRRRNRCCSRVEQGSRTTWQENRALTES